MRRILILSVAIIVAIFAACTHPADFLQEKRSTDCSDAPNGVVRFALLSDDNVAIRYEWSGNSYRKVGTEPTGEDLIRQFADGSIYKWHYWGEDVRKISRDAAGPGTILSAPYAMNRDRSLLAATVFSTRDSFEPAHRIVLIRVADSVAAAEIIDLDGSVDSLAWSPKGDALVVLSGREKYVRRTLRERISSAMGHPIPYADISLTTFGVDGKKRCSITPARELGYGRGYVRWDDQ
jgi:hypothetical protein